MAAPGDDRDESSADHRQAHQGAAARPRTAGAWKIAYADFVTAMMAFFLLMWLLGSTTEGDKKGIADYFKTPLQGGAAWAARAAATRRTSSSGGGTDLTRDDRPGQGRRHRGATQDVNLQGPAGRAAARRDGASGGLKQRGRRACCAANPKLAALKSQIRLDMTARRPAHPDRRRAEPARCSTAAAPSCKPYMRELLQRHRPGAARTCPTGITLEGHTDAAPFSGGERGYSNWELSADRANASRRELIAGGLPRTSCCGWWASGHRCRSIARTPPIPSNRRISIIVMNRDAEDGSLATASPRSTRMRRRARSPKRAPPRRPTTWRGRCGERRTAARGRASPVPPAHSDSASHRAIGAVT